MIRFSNGRKAQYFVASGALAFDGKGWPWERVQVQLELIRPELFTVILKSLTLAPRTGNLRWWKPWDCVRTIEGGAVNKVGLTNNGFEWWLDDVAPKLNFADYNIAVSLFGTEEEAVTMAKELDQFDLTAIEYNGSCPNTGHPSAATEALIKANKAVKASTRHPTITKVSADQDCIAIAKGLIGVVEAMSFNTLAHDKVFPGKRSPLYPLEKKVGGGGGGVSGKPLQKFNWPMMKAVHDAVPEMPLIASSIMEFEDLDRVRALGAKAESFGTIHLPDHPVWLKPWTIFTNPCKATKIVLRDMERNGGR